jgi:hypothetical protein
LFASGCVSSHAPAAASTPLAVWENELAVQPGCAPADGIAMVTAATPPTAQVANAPTIPRRTAAAEIFIELFPQILVPWVIHPLT